MEFFVKVLLPYGRGCEGLLLKVIEKRIINEFMDFIILFALKSNGDYISGYDAIKYVNRRFRFLPSSGTVYSQLYAMERDGLLRGVQKGRCRIYYLTQKGREFVDSVLRANGNIQKFVSMVFSVPYDDADANANGNDASG